MRAALEHDRELQSSCPCFDAADLAALPAPDFDDMLCRANSKTAYWTVWSADHNEVVHVYALKNKNVCRQWLNENGEPVLREMVSGISDEQAGACIELIIESILERGYEDCFY